MFKLFKKMLQLQYDVNEEQRDLIRNNFHSHNANIKWADGTYVLPANVSAFYKRGLLTFYNINNQLHVAVSYHKSEADAYDMNARPLAHIKYENVDDMALQKIKTDLN